jgi:hypothetical protein
MEPLGIEDIDGKFNIEGWVRIAVYMPWPYVAVPTSGCLRK